MEGANKIAPIHSRDGPWARSFGQNRLKNKVSSSERRRRKRRDRQKMRERMSLPQSVDYFTSDNNVRLHAYLDSLNSQSRIFTTKREDLVREFKQPSRSNQMLCEEVDSRDIANTFRMLNLDELMFVIMTSKTDVTGHTTHSYVQQQHPKCASIGSGQSLEEEDAKLDDVQTSASESDSGSEKEVGTTFHEEGSFSTMSKQTEIGKFAGGGEERGSIPAVKILGITVMVATLVSTVYGLFKQGFFDGLLKYSPFGSPTDYTHNAPGFFGSIAYQLGLNTNFMLWGAAAGATLLLVVLSRFNKNVDNVLVDGLTYVIALPVAAAGWVLCLVVGSVYNYLLLPPFAWANTRLKNGPLTEKLKEQDFPFSSNWSLLKDKYSEGSNAQKKHSFAYQAVFVAILVVVAGFAVAHKFDLFHWQAKHAAAIEAAQVEAAGTPSVVPEITTDSSAGATTQTLQIQENSATPAASPSDKVQPLVAGAGGL